MKRLIYLLMFSVLSIVAGAQENNTEVLNTLTHRARTLVNLAAGQISMGPVSNDPASPVSNLQLSMQANDVVINYQLAELGKEAKFYEIVPQLKFKGEVLSLSFYDELRGDWGKGLGPGPRQILWVNPLDRFLNLEGELEVSFTVNTWGIQELPYPCELGEPVFSNRQRLPYYLAAGAGVAGITIGQIFRAQRDKVYEDQYRPSDTEALAEPFYQDANSKHQTYLILTYAGAAILLTDATLYIIRQQKFKKDHGLWEKWCSKSTTSLELRPQLQAPAAASPNGVVGFQLSLSF